MSDTLLQQAVQIRDEQQESANTALRVGRLFVDIITLLLEDVNTDKIADGAVTTDKIADGAVTRTKLGSECVTTPKLSDDAVATDKIQDGAVTADKLAEAAVNTSNLVDSAVTTDKIADGAVTKDKIADDAVTSSRIKDGSVGYYKLSSALQFLIDGLQDGTSLLPESITFEKLAEDVLSYISQLRNENGNLRFQGLHDSTAEITWGIYENVLITEPKESFVVSFDTSTHRFVYCGPWDNGVPSMNLEHYPQFNIEPLGISSKNYGYNAFIDKTFSTPTGQRYRWNTSGNDIEEFSDLIIAMTEEELNDLQNPVEGAFYATYED